MSITLKLPNPQQHERIFLDDLIQRFKSKLISAADYILSLTNIYRPKGQKLNIPSAKAFYTQFGIAKSTFYRALKRLESLPELGFHWEPTGGISLWLGEAQETPTPTPEEKKPAYTKLKDLPKALQKEFESFVRSQYRKDKGQEIKYFHIFLKDSANFQNWWAKFQQYKTAKPAPAATVIETAPETTPETKRTSSPMPDRLKGLLGRKPT